MRLEVYGTGDFGSKKNTHFKLDDFFIDFPKNIRDFPDDYIREKIEKIIITHVHPDHYGDLNSFLLYRAFGPKPEIYTTKEIFDSMKSIAEPILSIVEDRTDGIFKTRYRKLEEHVKFKELKEESPLIDENYKIEVRYNIHIIPTIAIKITGPDGKKFAYSSDTEFNPETIEKRYKIGEIDEVRKERLLGFLWDADFIVHEAGRGDGHTPIEVLESLPEKIKEKLYIAHYPSDIKTNLKKLEAGKIYEI